MNPQGVGAPASRRPSSSLAFWAVAVCLLGCMLAVIPSTLFDLDRHSVPKEALLHVAGLLTAIPLLITGREFRTSRLDALLGAWLLVGFLSSTMAENCWLSLRSMSIAFSGVLLFWASRALSRQGLARRLQAAVAAATVAAAVTALLQAYGLEMPLFAQTRAPGGTFGNRNFMAHVLSLGLPTLLITGVRAETAFRRRALWVGTALVAAALVLSRTRAAWLAVGVSAAPLLFLAARISELRTSALLRRNLLGHGVAGLAGILLALVLPNALDWRSSNPYLETVMGVVDYKKGSGRGRIIQYRNTLGMLADHPLLGVGPGNWPVEYSLYASRRDPSLGAVSLMPTNPWPSSDWVGFLVEWGPAGLGLLAFSLGILGVRSWRRALRGGPWEDRLGAAVLVSTVTAAAVVGTVDSVLHLAAPSFLFWTALGSLAPPPNRAVRVHPGFKLRAGAVLAVLAVGGAAVGRSTAQGAAIVVAGHEWRTRDLEAASRLDPGNLRLHLLLAEGWIRRGRCDLALPHARAASRLYPHLAEPKRLALSCGRSP